MKNNFNQISFEDPTPEILFENDYIRIEHATGEPMVFAFVYNVSGKDIQIDSVDDSGANRTSIYLDSRSKIALKYSKEDLGLFDDISKNKCVFSDIAGFSAVKEQNESFNLKSLQKSMEPPVASARQNVGREQR